MDARRYGVGSAYEPPKMLELPKPVGHSLFGAGRSSVECDAGSSAASSRSSG